LAPEFRFSVRNYGLTGLRKLTAASARVRTMAIWPSGVLSCLPLPQAIWAMVLRNRISDRKKSTEPISSSETNDVHTTSKPAPR